MKRLKPYLPAMIVFLLALLVRLVYNLVVAQGYFASYDAAWYNQIAYAIAYNHCYCQYPGVPSLGRPPLWPFMLSLIYDVTPQPAFQQVDASIQVFYGRLLYCVIGSCTCLLVYFLARDLFGKRVGLITGCVAAIYPGLFIYDGWLYTESLYTFLVTAFTVSIYKLQRTRRMRWVVWSGIALGLANLARPNGPVLFGMLAIWAIGIILARDLPWQTVVKGALGTLLLTAAIIGPWTFRNYQVSGAFVMVSLGGGDVLMGSYNNNVAKSTTGLWTSPRYVRPRPDVPAAVLAGHDYIQYTPADDKIATNYALQWIQSHPGEVPLLMLKRLKTMWTPFTSEYAMPYMVFRDRFLSQVVWYMLNYMSPAIFILAAIGLILTWRTRKRQLLIVYASIGLTILQNMAFYGNMRFRAPIEPLLVLLAGGVLWWFTGDEPGTLRSWRTKRKRRELADAVEVGSQSPQPVDQLI